MSSDGCEGLTEAGTCRPDGTGGTEVGGGESTARVRGRWYLGGARTPPPQHMRAHFCEGDVEEVVLLSALLLILRS